MKYQLPFLFLFLNFFTPQLLADTNCCGQANVTATSANNYATLVYAITNTGVKVFRIGDTLTLVLPTNRFFPDDTSQLDRNKYRDLNQIAALLGSVEKYDVKISGYASSGGDDFRALALSRQQAQTVANYLWEQGIDARLLSAVGYGKQAPADEIVIEARLFTEPDDI